MAPSGTVPPSAINAIRGASAPPDASAPPNGSRQSATRVSPAVTAAADAWPAAASADAASTLPSHGPGASARPSSSKSTICSVNA
jgi:hypothetical protein